MKYTRSEEEIKHFGVKGQSWYNRYHESYSSKPTRSGKIGTEHFVSGEKSKKTKYERNREKILRDQKLLNKYMTSPKYKFTTEELNAAADLFSAQNRVSNSSKKAYDYAKRGSDWLETLSSSAVYMKRLYQVVGPLIGLEDPWERKNKQTKHWDSDYGIQHFGVKGQRWYHRYHQSYKTVGTRSGKIGEEHFTKIQPEGKKASISTEMYVALQTITKFNRMKPKIIDMYSGDFRLRRYREIRSKNLKVGAESGLPIKQEEYSIKQDLKEVNPTREQENCQICSVTYELRRRGYDVFASRRDNSTYGSIMSSKAFKGAEMKPLTNDLGNGYSMDYKTLDIKYKLADKNPIFSKKEYTNTIISRLEQEPKGSRGELCIIWTPRGSAHSVSYEIDKSGKLHVYDSQRGTEVSNRGKEYFYNSIGVGFSRLDDKKINPDYIKEVIVK